MTETYVALALGMLALVLEHLRSRSAVTCDDLHALAERVARLEGKP